MTYRMHAYVVFDLENAKPRPNPTRNMNGRRLGVRGYLVVVEHAWHLNVYLRMLRRRSISDRYFFPSRLGCRLRTPYFWLFYFTTTNYNQKPKSL